MTTWKTLKQNPNLFPRYYTKEYIIKACRRFFEERGYHELESPILTPSLPQERYLDVLRTQVTDEVYLIPSTETFNKKILAAGLGEHFVITKVFRGLEQIGPNHSPEFTMLEWYHLNANYFDLMDDCEKLFQYIKKYLDEKFVEQKPSESYRIGNTLSYQGKEINISSPWDRFSVIDALKKFADIDFSEIQSIQSISKVAKDKGIQVGNSYDWQTIYELIWGNLIEPNLSETKPTFIYDFPRILCPLTKVNENNPLVSEKVELYIAGKEIANGYTELQDWKEQERRFLEEQSERKALGKEAIKLDVDLIEALKSGIPDVAGIGMGLDRVAMIFADAKNIADVNYFPATEWE